MGRNEKAPWRVLLYWNNGGEGGIRTLDISQLTAIFSFNIK